MKLGAAKVGWICPSICDQDRVEYFWRPGWCDLIRKPSPEGQHQLRNKSPNFDIRAPALCHIHISRLYIAQTWSLVKGTAVLINLA